MAGRAVRIVHGEGNPAHPTTFRRTEQPADHSAGTALGGEDAVGVEVMLQRAAVGHEEQIGPPSRRFLAWGAATIASPHGRCPVERARAVYRHICSFPMPRAATPLASWIPCHRRVRPR